MQLTNDHYSVIDKFNKQKYIEKEEFNERVAYIIENINVLSHNWENQHVIWFIGDTNNFDYGKTLCKSLPEAYVFFNCILSPGAFSIRKRMLYMLKRLKYSYNKDIDHRMVTHVGQELYSIDKNDLIHVLEKIIQYTNNTMGEMIASYLMKNPMEIPDSLLKKCCKNQPYMWPVLDYLLSQNYKLSYENFFKIPDVNIMKKVVQYITNPITEEQFIEFLTYTVPSPESIAESRKQSANRYDEYHHNTKYVASYTDEKFELFVTMGLQITKKSIIESIIKNITLPDIDRFGIEINMNEIMECCTKHKYYPKYSFMNASESLLKLRNLSTSTNTKELKAFLKKHPTVIPDRICLLNSGTTKLGSAFNMLVDHGGVVTLEILNKIYHNKVDYAIEKFTKESKKQLNYQLEILNALLPIIKNNPKLFKDDIFDYDLIKLHINDLSEMFNLSQNMEQV